MKKGFTLIELLAVIVILAIIALIATPIILEVINNTSEESNKRSVEMYADAIKNSVAKVQLDSSENILGSFKSSNNGKTLTNEETSTILTVEYDGDVVCDTVEIYEDGQVYLSNCKVNGQDIDYTYGKQKEVVSSSVCTLAPDSTVTGTEKGAKYLCKVDPNKDEYTFYVLGTNLDGTTNLILERNICENGDVAESGDDCFIQWQESSGENTKGPVTAMDYLYNATSNWSKASDIIMDYIDEGSTGTYGYESIKTSGTTTTIKSKDGTVQATYEKLKARLPYKSEIKPFDSVTKENAYLYGYLTNIGIEGYWTLSSNGDDSYYACGVYYDSGVYCEMYMHFDSPSQGGDNYTGIRPVITLKI